MPGAKSMNYPKFRDDLFIHCENHRILYLYPVAPDWITINEKYRPIFDKFTGEHKIEDIYSFIEGDYTSESTILIPQIKSFVETSKLFTHNNIDVSNKFQKHLPKYIYLTLTDQCNLQCVYCYAKERKKRLDTSLEGWCLFVESILKITDKCTFIFTGGEPLTVAYVFELAKFIKEKGCSSILLTNGTLITSQEIASKVKNLFEHVRLSLDSIREEVNSKLRGPNTLDKVIKAVKFLELVGANYVVMPTINNLNKDEVDNISKFFNGKVYFQPFYEMGAGRNCHELTITGDDYYTALTNSTAYRYLQGYHKTINNYKNRPYKRCALACEEISIASNGDVFPCHMLHYEELKIGNLNEEEFDTLYYASELLNELRNINVDTIEQCKSCIYRNFCGGACRARVDFKNNGITGFNEF